MRIRPLKARLGKYLIRHNLTTKFEKQCKLLLQNYSHPSLNIELMEPKKLGNYSFRIDRKYRAVFISLGEEIEIIDVNNHYR